MATKGRNVTDNRTSSEHVIMTALFSLERSAADAFALLAGLMAEIATAGVRAARALKRQSRKLDHASFRTLPANHGQRYHRNRCGDPHWRLYSIRRYGGRR
jgi:hypothetical protein